ncbi:outer membrane lipoprotein carrier protein LolA, partial [Elusimicrobiota bacterium]
MFKKIFIFIFLCSITSNLYSAELSLEEIMSEMDLCDEKIESVRFDFKQDIIYEITGETQTNSGAITLQRPSKFYIVQKKPVEQIIVSNGKKVWIYTPTYNQVLVER